MSARRRPTGRVRTRALPRAIWRSVLILLGGFHITCILPFTASAQSSPPVIPTAHGRYDIHIAEAATRFRLPPTWIRAVLGAESAGDQRATSRKGAMGLMQIVPDTWSDLRVRYRLGADPYDPHDNIIAGSAYIRELVDRYGSPGWIAAYNAGPGRYEASLGGRQLPAETRAYVAVVSSAISKDGSAKATCSAASAGYGWRYAPLFATQLGGSPGDCALQMERSRDNASRVLPLQELTGAGSRSTGLFVPKASERSAP
jgi:hypothetical protein